MADTNLLTPGRIAVRALAKYWPKRKMKRSDRAGRSSTAITRNNAIARRAVKKVAALYRANTVTELVMRHKCEMHTTWTGFEALENM